MAEVKAFKALRYADTKNLYKKVTPPYDIISEAEQDEFYKKDCDNIIRLEYGKTFEDDNEISNRYTRANEFLKEWKEKGILKNDTKNAFYIYEEEFIINGETKAFKGIFSRVKLEEFNKKIILPHEETLSKAKADRFNLMKSTNCNFSPIYLLYSDEEKKIVDIINNETTKEADISFEFNGVTQKLWILTDEDKIDAIEKDFSDKQLFIADGHHRYETALNYRNSVENRTDGFNYVMAFLAEMDDDGLLVFPTHRIVGSLENFNEDETLKALEKDYEIKKVENLNIEKEIASDDKKVFGFYTGKDYFYKLILKNDDVIKEYLPEKTDSYRDLDVSVLHSSILEKIFKIDSVNMANGKNLTYTRSQTEAIEKVRSGEFQCAFIINATKISQIKAVSLNNEKMPQKSTYFYPKLVTGIVMNDLEI